MFFRPSRSSFGAVVTSIERQTCQQSAVAAREPLSGRGAARRETSLYAPGLLLLQRFRFVR